MSERTRNLAAIGLSVAFAACGGGGGSGTGEPPPSNVNLGTVLAGTRSTFESPAFVAVDSAGDVYTTDFVTCAVYKTTPSGTTALAGMPGIAGAEDGIGGAARFNEPQGVAVDSAGNVYVADSSNHAIRKITPAGAVTTVAGRLGVPGFSDGSGSTAMFAYPVGLAIGPDGAIYVADQLNNAVRRVTPSGSVSTVLPNAPLVRPRGITLAGNGDIYVVTESWVNKIWTTGQYTTVALQPLGANAVGIVIDGSGAILISGAPRHSSFPTGKIYRNVGTDWVEVAGADTPGALDGPNAAARFRQLGGLTIDGTGNLFVADTENGAVRKISTDGWVSTLAGTAMTRGFADGAGPAARFAYPWAITHGPDGMLYVTDFYNNAVRKVSTSGKVSTFAGQGPDVSVFSNLVLNPTGITPVGNALWVVGSNYSNYTAGAAYTNVTQLAIGPGGGGQNWVLENFATVQYLAAAADGTVYMSIFQAIFKWPFGTGSTPFLCDLAGRVPCPFYDPRGMVVDSAGNLFVADRAAGVIFKVTPTAAVSTFAGAIGVYGHTDGVGTDARFFKPYQLAIDERDNLYVVHMGALRKITPSGVVSTIGLKWGTPSLHGITVTNGMVYGVTSDAVIQATLPP